MSSPTPRSPAGLRSVLTATAIAGVGGYLITVIVAPALGSDYALFAVYWSALYLAVGTLSGVQQEVTRASGHHGERHRPLARAGPFAAGAAVVVAVVVAGSSPFWAPLVFGEQAAALAASLTFGAVAYTFVATMLGVMYGNRMWRPLSVAIVLDVALRLVLLICGILLGYGVAGLAWATVIPFPLVLLMVGLTVGNRMRGGSVLDVGYRQIGANVARTVAAAAATSTLVNGFPLLLGASSPGESPESLSALIFALILTRGPLVVFTLALQSYLVLYFRDRIGGWQRPLLLLSGGIGVLGVVLALLAWWIGVDIIVAVAGESFRLDRGYLGLLVLASVPTAWITITGAAVLARADHTVYSSGWVIAAVVGAALLFTPGDLYQRSIVALVGGPIVGLAVHIGALIFTSRSRTPGEAL